MRHDPKMLQLVNWKLIDNCYTSYVTKLKLQKRYLSGAFAIYLIHNFFYFLLFQKEGA